MKNLDFHYDTVRSIAGDMGKLNLRPRIDAGHAGHRFDIIADAPNGRSVAVELKHWADPTKEMLAKAEREAELLTGRGTVSRAFVVIPQLADSEQTDRVRNLAGLRESLIRTCGYQPGGTASGDFGRDGVVEVGKVVWWDIFVAMPFAAVYEDTFFQAIEPAADTAGAACNRVDVKYVSGQILDLIHAGIERCDLVVADLSGGNANVTYELGYAHALKKPVVHISSTPADDLPFDLRQWQTIGYNLGQTYLLKQELQKVIPRLLGLRPKAT